MMGRTVYDARLIQTCSSMCANSQQMDFTQGRWVISFGMKENETKHQNYILTTFQEREKKKKKQLPETIEDGITD